MLDPATLCDLDAEQALLGAAMLDRVAADECLAAVPTQALYREPHRRIWEALRSLRADGSGCDLLTVADALSSAGRWDAVEAAGGASYLGDLCASVPAVASARQYAAAVLEAYVRREARAALQSATAVCGDPGSSMDEVRAAMERGVQAVAEAMASKDAAPTLDSLVADAWRYVEAMHDGSEAPGMSMGLPVLDRCIGGGLHPGELTVLGGRPSVGKSSLAQQIAHAAARQGRRVLFASAEMDGRTVALRALAHEGGVDSRKLRGSPRLQDGEWPRLSHAVGELSRWGACLMVDAASRTMPQIAAQARRLHARDRLSLLVVDHLQHLRQTDRQDNRAQAVGRMAAECKDLATTLGIAVIALSQLNREAPNAGREPRVSDLRESGEIEQLADVVLLLHRDADTAPPPVVDVACIIAKQRNGEIGKLTLRHERATGRWTEPPGTQRRDAAGWRDAG